MQWLKKWWRGLWSNTNDARLFRIIGIIVFVYVVLFLIVTFICPVRCWFIDHLGYTKEDINKLYKHLTLIATGLTTLAFQYFRVKIRDQQVENQKNQTENQIEQTENLSKQVENQARQTDEQAKQTENLSKDISLKTKTQQDEQFKKAIELLSNSSSTFAARAGAVYMLAALGCESQTHAQSCLDMLAELNRWMGQRLVSDPNYFDRGKQRHSQVVTLDNQQQVKESLEAEDLSRLALLKIADIIKTHAHGDATPNKKLSNFNLQGKFLCQINLMGLNLGDRIDFTNTRLQGAKLMCTQLQGANLYLAEMQGANLRTSQMQGANLREAEMQGANLGASQMQGANLGEANMQGAYLEFALLQGANLRASQMQGAYLKFALLQGAIFDSTNMKGISIGQHFKTFEKRVSPRPNVEELESQQTGVLTDAYIKKIIDDLKEKEYAPQRIIDKVKKLGRHQTGKLTDEHIKTIIDDLKENKNVSQTIIDEINETLQSRKDQSAQLDGIKYGKLSQEECDTIIKSYNEAMKGVPERDFQFLDE